MNIFQLLFWIIVYNCILILLCLSRTRPGQPGRNLVWFLGFFTAWVACELIIELPYATRETVIWVARAMYGCGTGILVSWLWFCAGFPTASPRFTRFSWVMTYLGLPWAVLVWTPYVIVGSSAPPWLEHLQRNPQLVLVWGLWVLVAYLAGLAHLWHKQRSLHGYQRMQIRYMLLGTAITIGTGIVFDVIVPTVTHSSSFGVLGPLSTLVMTGMMTYAIVQHRLFDITRIYRSGLTYTAVTATLSVFLALTVPYMGHLFIRNLQIPFHYLLFVYALLMMLISRPLWNLAQRGLDWLFFRQHYDPQALLQRSGSALTMARDHQEIGLLLTSLLKDSVRPRRFALYVPANTGYTRIASADPSGVLPDRIEATDTFLQYQLHHHEPLITDEAIRWQSETAEVGERLAEWQVAVSVPCFVYDRCTAILFVGVKHSGNPLTVDDLQFLNLLSTQLALTLENIAYYNELREINATLEERVSERTAALSDANAQLVEADGAKDRFLATVSHELLTPLTSILGWAETGQEMTAAHEMQRALQIIHQNARRQQVLVNELLDTSRLTFGKFTLACEYTDLWTIAEAAGIAQQHHAAERGLQLHFSPPGCPLPVYADPLRIGQVISNLLVNALKFTPAGGSITMVGTVQDEAAIISIHDTGCGLTPAQIANVFALFTQANNGQEGGLGLGLALAKGITDLHGGSVQASSAGLGQGSTFELHLPLTELPDGLDAESVDSYSA